MKITISPILSEADYNEALGLIAALMDAVPGTREGAKLDVLATLVEAYEEQHWRIGLPDPVEAIHARMEQMGLRAKDLEPLIGSRGRVSEILSGKRSRVETLLSSYARLGPGSTFTTAVGPRSYQTNN